MVARTDTVIATAIETLYCPTCARESLTEAPPCLDGHEDCPERACVECGTALVLDAGLIALITPDHRRRVA